MKFKPTTLALIAIAILLGGVVYFTETRNSSSPETTEEAGGSIFEFEESQVQSFTVETPAQTLSFENEAGQWQVQQPESAPASDASVAYLLNLLATGESDRTLTVPTADLAEFGLDQPSATINVVLDSEETHQLIWVAPTLTTVRSTPRLILKLTQNHPQTRQKLRFFWFPQTL